ncbi:MAG TPA: toast rack family protein [Bryobacteraceae bacterium]|jgi:hypothetical protein
MLKKKPIIRVFLAVVSTLILAACEFDTTPTGPLKDEPFSLDRGNVERANIQLNMGAGEMNLRGGTGKLMEGRFEYNVPAWKPQVETSVNGTHATVTIRQPQHFNIRGNKRYVWDLRLNDQVITDLALNCGAGQAQLELGSLTLRDLSVHMGAGQVELDLRGKPTRDYEVNISGGVGQATVHLPDGIGIWAEAHGGLGSITVTGLDKQGDHWQNSLYDNAKVNVRLKVQGGIGEIRIIA